MNDNRTNRFIKEVLDSTNKLVNIDINDIRDLFQEDEEIHAFDVSVPADKENRIMLLVEQIKKCSKCHEQYNRVLVFFYFPSNLPLLMEEIQPFSDWIESVPGELMIKWGMATQSIQKLRSIVLLQ